ncbi:MAG TPA: hypothetical protein VK781_12720, partial [Solirubrobacteraceae bacterium]|nr:hypothetical protein [Solirubrobacteraceae bacterium]
ADNHSVGVRPDRARRAGSLLGRLRQLREPAQRPIRRENRPAPGLAGGAEDGNASEDGLYDFLEGGSIERAEPYEQELYIGSVEASDPARGAWDSESDGALSDGPQGEETGQSRPAPGGQPSVRSASTSGELKVARALEVFNAGEQPRRVAGVARSLGAPSVTVRPLEESGSTVAIVVAWELCWYRYEVDLGDEAAGSQLVAQGMELDELPEEDRLANAAADERGELAALLV